MTFSTRLFVGAFGLLLLTMGILNVLADRWLRGEIEQLLASQLEGQARLVATAMAPGTTALNAAAHRFGALTGRRITLIAPDGTVLGDSEFDDASLALLDNHADRPEVAAALAGDVGVARRHGSATARREIKVAIPAAPGVVRISAPVDEVDALMGSTARATLVAAFFALLVGSVLAALGGRQVARPIRQLAASAQTVAAGGAPSLPASRIPEIRALVRAFRTMHEEIAARLAQLRREREETETIIASMVEGVIATNRRGDIVVCNAATRRLLGFEPDAALPNLRQMFHQRDAREVVEAVLEGVPVPGREITHDGAMLLVTGRPLPDGGAVLGLLDITDVKRLQAVRRDFVANVSHELKTPLTSILGYAETLLNDRPDPDTAERFLATIRANARRMQRLVDDLLDLARLESGGWSPHWETLALDAVVDEAWQAVSGRADERGVALENVYAAGTSVAADAGALREILINLFDNAVRHTPRGGRITVRATRRDHETELAVADTGAGIPREHLPRVFERFYRADPGRSRAEGGTGLGLAIVKHFTEAHGGTVTIESAVGRGTTVRLRFPAHT